MEEPLIKRKRLFTVVGLKYRGKNENQEIPRLWPALSERIDEIRHIVNPDIAYGVMGNMDRETGEFDYLAGVETESAEQLAEGMSSWEIPEQSYAVFACTLPTLMETFDHIYQEWLPTSDYQRTDGPEFEYYDENFDPRDPDSIFYLYVPVRSGSNP